MNKRIVEKFLNKHYPK